MNNVCGMSIADFNNVIEEMRNIYSFKNEKAYISNLQDSVTHSQRRVEIITSDEKSGIQIVMSKGVFANGNESVYESDERSFGTTRSGCGISKGTCYDAGDI